MSDQTAGVAPGSLSGINLTGADEEHAEAPEATLPPEDDRTLGDAATEAVEAPEAPEAPTPDPEPEPEVAPEGEPEPADDPEFEPEPEPAAAGGEETAEAPKQGAPQRPYVVLKDLGEDKFHRVHEVKARNAQNAMRQAFKDLTSGDGDVAEATLVVIPKTMFRPTPVRLNKTERVSVQFG